MVFDSFREALEDWMNRATPPEERRAIAARMRDTLVQAKMGLQDLRDSLGKARKQMEAEQRELDTVRRRKQLAEGIGDAETVAVAAKYEDVHVQRVDIVSRKVAAQEAELALAEREVETMSSELRAVLSGAGPMGGPAVTDATGGGDDIDVGGESLRAELDSLGRARGRAERDAEAARRLEELKRRMGR